MKARGTLRPVSIAPMMDRTDRHYRFLMRRITKKTLLYTEMVSARAIVRGDRDRLLAHDASEHPLSLQVGGDDPLELSECARIAEDRGFDELNLNVGCPSARVQTGNFGACLMSQPEVVARAVEAMRGVCSLPITVKHRIGVDDLDQYEDMLSFVNTVAAAGCDRFSVHARKAWLQGLSPKENRTVPPLRHDEVHRLKSERPDLMIELNGGVTSWEHTRNHLAQVDAVMIGRWAYDQPWAFSTVDREFFASKEPLPVRSDVIESMVDYGTRLLHEEPRARIGHVARHMMGLFAGEPGARHWRRGLSQMAFQPGAKPQVLRNAAASHFTR